MKKISIYIKGNRQSTAYYRIYQYFDKMTTFARRYHTMMSDSFHDRYMPISRQPLRIKVLAYVHICFRMFVALCADCLSRPDVLVIHKRIVSRFMPPGFNLLLRFIHCSGTKIIWDFDDHIMANGEVSSRQFRFYSYISDRIVVTHQFLAELVPASFRDKVTILPTTDGDMYRLFREGNVNEERLKEFGVCMNLVWVGTSVNLEFVQGVIGCLERVAYKMKSLNGKNLCLNVVCDKPLVVQTEYLELHNIKWSRQKAIEAMCRAHVGIMPLVSNEFTKGKGGFKLVQYLSVGLPCIGSAVGFNNKVLSEDCGFLVSDCSEWEKAVLALADRDAWQRYSDNAFHRWNREFSYEHNLAMWHCFIEDLI